MLVVYYSRTGKTKEAAEIINKRLGCDIEEIHDEINRKGPIGFIRSGHDAIRGKITRISAAFKDPSDYDLIIIGSPVWAGHISSAMRTYLILSKDKIKQAAFFDTQASNDDCRIFDDMEKLIDQKPVHILKVSAKDLKNEDYKKKIEEFCRNVTEA